MNLTKFEKAHKKSIAFKGCETAKHIKKNLDDDAEILQTLTVKQLAAVINVANRSYHDGKSSCQAEIADDCFWIGGTVQKLIPIKALEALEIKRESQFDSEGYSAMLSSGKFSLKTFSNTITTYALNYMESSNGTTPINQSAAK